MSNARNLAGYEEATARARAARARYEATPAYLLGVAQAAIRDALMLHSAAEIHAHLAEALGRIKPEVTV